ncbi:MAG: GntR family transcriptional regulator [Bacteroidales bacterium]|nr:GntR family transcriptional regulator [Bacteroidales bacterium]
MAQTPQYRRIYELLRKHIVDGVYKEGDLLPSENELCRVHNITRPTVRQALDALVHGGFIKKQQGKGSIVSSLPQGIGILSVSGTTSAVGINNLKTKILTGPEVRAWAGAFMFPLSQVEKESGYVYIERLRILDEKPIFLDVNFLPNINLPRFTSRSFENRSLFDILRKFYNIQVTGGEQRLRAIKADENIGNHLQVKKGHPVLHLERKIATNRVDYYFYSSIYCNTDISAIYGAF